MQYLVRTKLSKMQRKGKRPVVAHLWDGADTLCTLYSTGGIRRKDTYEVTSDPRNFRLCTLCTAETDGKNLSKEVREAILRDQGLGGSDLAQEMEEASGDVLAERSRCAAIVRDLERFWAEHSGGITESIRIARRKIELQDEEEAPDAAV